MGKTFNRLSHNKAAYWGEQKGGLGFSKTSLKITINRLIHYCYFNVRNVTMKQTIGIPTGTAPAPLWANVHNNLRICN